MDRPTFLETLIFIEEVKQRDERLYRDLKKVVDAAELKESQDMKQGQKYFNNK